MKFWALDPAVSHLNHGSFGAAPLPVLEAQRRLRDLMEANPTRFMLETYQPMLDAARERLAEYIGADPEGLVLVANATAGVNAVLRSLESTLRPGDEILITDHTYNACRNAAQVSAARTGAKVVTAGFPYPIAGPGQVTEGVMAAVTDRTRLVMLDAVTFSSAIVLPLREITARLEPEAAVLVDAAHAPGMVDFDVAEIGASYITANCHKWMCAAKGSGFLYVRPDRRERIYAAVISHGYNGAWPSTGGRLHQQFDWTGTDDPTAWLTIPEAIDAMASLQPDGWEGVRRANRDLCLRGRDVLAAALGVPPPAPDEMLGSIASFPLPGRAGSENGGAEVFDPLMGRLRSEWNIEVPVFAHLDPPQRLLRISAQQYNRLDEYERLAEALQAELKRESPHG